MFIIFQVVFSNTIPLSNQYGNTVDSDIGHK